MNKAQKVKQAYRPEMEIQELKELIYNEDGLIFMSEIYGNIIFPDKSELRIENPYEIKGMRFVIVVDFEPVSARYDVLPRDFFNIVKEWYIDDNNNRKRVKRTFKISKGIPLDHDSIWEAGLAIA